MRAPKPADSARTPVSSRAHWVSLGPAAEFTAGALRLVRVEGHHLVVARTEDGRVFCLDDRCPHEGYPLSQGTLKGCALTCCWHNWKFDVQSGACTLGEEAVRAYPVRTEGSDLLVDLAPPDPEERIAELRASFETGILRGEVGRSVRDGIRMLQAGHPARELLADVAVLDAHHAEYGCSHVLPVAADLAHLLGSAEGPETMTTLAHAIDLCADTNVRTPRRPVPEPVPVPVPVPAPAPVAGGDGATLRLAVEREETEAAEALLRGAFRAGRPRAEVEYWLFATLSDHFLDFGHSLIYLVKARELLASLAAPEARAAEIYPALLYGILVGTREDTLPYMRTYSRFLAGVEAELPEVWERCRTKRADFDAGALRDAVLDGRSEEALDQLWGALCHGADLERVARALVAAAAHRLLRYDAGLEHDGSVAENFLWATHRLTFASAARQAARDFESPDALRFLFHSLAFTHSGRAMDVPGPDRGLPEPREGAAADVVAALVARDPARAMGLARFALRTQPAELRAAVEEFALSDPVVRPIAVAHVIKTTVCAFDEYAAADEGPDREVPVLAALRTWALPLVERRVRQSAEISLRWVVDGEVPRKLTQ